MNVTNTMVKQAALSYGVIAKRINGEWQLLHKKNSLLKRIDREKLTYYTDCNEDAYLTMSRIS